MPAGTAVYWCRTSDDTENSLRRLISLRRWFEARPCSDGGWQIVVGNERLDQLPQSMTLSPEAD